MTENSQLGPSTDGTVMIDIGADRGALIIETSPVLLLSEIEISANDTRAGPTGPQARTHVAVRERRGRSAPRYAAVFPSLPAGDYTVWGLDGDPAGTTTISGGRITQLDWR
ncbi:MAG: hypothetical protein ACRDP1_02040 [Nocardioidaceae bacterium]